MWHQVGAPYIAARLRVLLAQACRALGDGDTAALELDLAREVFERLGAAPDLAALRGAWTRRGDAGGGRRAARAASARASWRCSAWSPPARPTRPSPRQLFLSEKTIDRHVSNIFAKVNVASRAAATAYAYENGLV